MEHIENEILAPSESKDMYQDVPRFPSKRDINFTIELVPRVVHVSKTS